MDREWVDGMETFRTTYVNEVPLLRDENASLRAQLESSVSRIDALEQQLKHLLDSITGTRTTEPEPEPMPEPEPKAVTVELVEKLASEAVSNEPLNSEAVM